MREIRTKREWQGSGYPEVTCDSCGWPVRAGYLATVWDTAMDLKDMGAHATVYLHRECIRSKRYIPVSEWYGSE